MPKPNTKFELSVKDIDLIEHALRTCDLEPEETADVLAKLHHQKNWYRPKDKFTGGG